MTPAERELQTAVRRLTKIVEDQGREIRTLKTSRRAPQLGHSSIDSGALEVRDPETQATRMRIGWVNGEAGISYEGGSSVSSPSAPVVTPSLGGLRVTWDGTLSGDVSIPVDFDHMAVHVSTTSGFVPSAATYVGGIRRAGEGGMLPVVPLPYVPHYVVLVPVTTGGVQGVPSAEVAATPLQTSGADLQADSVDAVHIKTGAVEASKLEAVLVLASTIIAGIPGAARAEMDQDGIRGYDSDNVLIFAVDSSGNAVFSGDIVASEISGSRFALPDPDTGGGIYIEMDDYLGWPRILVTSGAETTAPGVVIQDAMVDVRSRVLDVGGPAIRSSAYATSAHHVVETGGTPDAARIRTRATETSANLEIQPPWSGPAGTVYGYVKASGAPAIGYTSPAGGAYPYQSSQIELEGSHDGRAASQATYWADQHIVLRGANTVEDDGVWALDDAVSLLSNRHAPTWSSWSGAQPTFATTGAFVDFTAAQWAPITFRTGWSGRVRVTIQCAGINNATNNSSLATGFRLSGASTVPVSLVRCAYIRSRGAGVSEPMPALFVLPMQLVGNASYTLTPTWRISGGSASTASYYATLDNTITVEPLM